MKTSSDLYLIINSTDRCMEDLIDFFPHKLNAFL